MAQTDHIMLGGAGFAKPRGFKVQNLLTEKSRLRPRQFAIADGGKARLENCIYLFERK